MMNNVVVSGGSYAQTLSRGVSILETLANDLRPLGLRELVAELGLSRSVVYRLLRTLEAHRLVRVRANGKYELGPGLFALARGVGFDLRALSRPILENAARKHNATVILSVVDGNEVVCLVSVEPPESGVRVTHREGRRHEAGRGSSGIAVLAAMPPQEDEREVVTRSRNVGYSVSSDEMEQGVVAASAPLGLPMHDWVGAVSLLFVQAAAPSPKEAGEAAQQIAHDISAAHHHPAQ